MKIIISIMFVFITTVAPCQIDKKQNENIATQNTNAVTYRLFPTQNVWTFIKLNTRNGQMWQVQYNMESEKRFATDLSLKTLVDKDKEANDRFTLYPTTNTYTFMLLDQTDGRVWQIQWSMEEGKRGIVQQIE